MALGRGIWGTITATIAAAFLLVGLAAGATAADTRYCRHLRAQLASAPATQRNATMLKRYERAIADQEDELSRTHRIARRSGCAGLFGDLRDDPSGRCDPIARTIGKMERNMAMLERRRDAFARKADAPSRQEILAAIDANGCREEQVAARRLPAPVSPDSDSSALFSRADPGVVIHRSGPPQEGDEMPAAGEPNESGADASGTYRTMCVRTCDGYYFPISFATSPANFARDEQTCQARCPGTKVELYYHVSSEESESMVSLAGAPYEDLPTAFLYRKAGAPRVPGCTCAVGKRSSIIAATPPGEDQPGEEAPASQALAQPKEEPAVKAEAVNPAGEAVASEPTPLADKDRKVRVVGPRFLPDPSKALDLRAPAPKKAP
ncbi:DUF2865 domain-containing protein [Mesorhizobium koreense]|uniref:DUF2865 domain-containing protein n=1 Tax=Mesorhizobium koreense TaxID=3074855 RepID=UPI00287B68E1|nr:DUF2865 domain-containing protein [Mesorhizobium sp. WR6]